MFAIPNKPNVVPLGCMFLGYSHLRTKISVFIYELSLPARSARRSDHPLLSIDLTEAMFIGMV